ERKLRHYTTNTKGNKIKILYQHYVLDGFLRVPNFDRGFGRFAHDQPNPTSGWKFLTVTNPKFA
ncbi:hypothetical protein GIB67_029069, partial [Kingdonia uniflora]